MDKPLCVIVPDVHGRSFWKDIKDYDCDIIFLGDYLDPYSFEGINKQQALDNFTEILDYVEGKDNITMLLGNHDCEYVIGRHVCDCRCDNLNYDIIQNLFLENIDKFCFAAKKTYAGKDFLFSHAGFHPSWMLKYHWLDINSICETRYSYDLDDPVSDFTRFTNTLCDVSKMRGGWNAAGSIIWADIQEFINEDLSDIGYEQIVGHTYLKNVPVGIDGLTCIDLQRIFIINKNGVLCEKDFTPINKYIFNSWKTNSKK